MVHHADYMQWTDSCSQHTLVEQCSIQQQRDGLLGPFGKNWSRASSGARRLQAFASALFALMGAPLNTRIADT